VTTPPPADPFKFSLTRADIALATGGGAIALTHCPFREGAATLDLLLAELDPRDRELFDAALDLRSLCTDGTNAAACVTQLFRVRSLLDQRHYLAFYRVRCWARRALRIEARAGRGEPWITREFPLDCARLDEAVNATRAAFADERGAASAALAQVRFSFARE
jgi:hypothetical protein